MVKSLAQDVLHFGLPDSPKVESTSSYGSSSSSPSMANFPPIKVRVDHMNQIVGLDEQLSQLNVNHVSPPSLPLNNVGDWAVSDDDISEQGEPTGGMRKAFVVASTCAKKVSEP
ncbi:hypothetical protein L6452_38469 [Arctium lappa]|uniref:Uncharacterized protein n=1 Tax=Arctium lappa TaxID=4217 RepID=A0ACB8XQS5_ARCLA|nr:hypothetical protein L6452_38469 [Arctium lappa]